MTPERRRHIKEIFNGALERQPGERALFIDSVCAGDEAAQRKERHQIRGRAARFSRNFDDMLVVNPHRYAKPAKTLFRGSI
jgi:hypothetical protein